MRKSQKKLKKLISLNSILFFVEITHDVKNLAKFTTAILNTENWTIEGDYDLWEE
jgi:hypothetical protein